MSCFCGGPHRETGISSVYALQRLLGKGAQGEVWLARERSTGKNFALKFMSIKGSSPPHIQMAPEASSALALLAADVNLICESKAVRGALISWVRRCADASVANAANDRSPSLGLQWGS